MKIRKRFIALLCLAILLVTGMPVGVVIASEKAVHYVALGDSIAAGYGLEGYIDGIKVTAPKDSYQSILTTKLGATSVNDAVSGMTSQELIDLLESGACDLELSTADYVTISIGSNDILGLFLKIASSIVEVKENESLLDAIDRTFREGDLLKILIKLEELCSMIADNEEIHQAAKAFTTQFQRILAIVKEKAPNAKIFATNIYNPYAALQEEWFPLGSYAEGYIKEMNEAFDTNSTEYTLIDAYQLFSKGNLVHVTFDLSPKGSVNFDPHPNKAGHQVLAEAFLTAIEETAMVKVSQATIQSIVSKRANQVKVKLEKQEAADGYTIYYATKKNGDYQELKTSKKATITIQANQLISGKTYYIKASAYTLNGTTKVYGERSKAKKVVIS